MTVHQHAVEVRTFAQYLRDMTAVLDPARGWFGVFRGRDPEGMRACLDGAEVPPWDVVESLLQDLAAARGAEFAERESVRAAALYSASAAAHDRRPGGRHALTARLELMLQERERAGRRLDAVGMNGTHTPQGESRAWARDDLERATARCTELSKRLAAVAKAVPEDWFRAEGSGSATGEGRARTAAAHGEPSPPRPHSGPEAEAGATAGRQPAPWAEPDRDARETPAPTPRRGKPRGARFAGLEPDEDTEDGGAPSVVPVLPAPPPAAAVAPRGARFRGAPVHDADADGAPDTAAPAAVAEDPGARGAAREVVELLVGLRAEGRSGEAHVVLCEASAWQADRLPVLADALHRAGLDADRATLLWEVSSMPPPELAAAAAALAAAGRPGDCEQLLRQGVARPAAEIAEAVVALERAGREAEARALLGAFVRVRTPQDAAMIAQGGPRHLVPHLLAAAREVSAAREWDLLHALRMAGIVVP